MKLPKAFKKAIVQSGMIYFRTDMGDAELVELMEWKLLNHIKLIKTIVLKNLYHKNRYQDDIKTLFKKSHQLSYLGINVK